MKENRNRRIIKVAQQIKSNVDNGGKIWETKQKVQRKNQTPRTNKDEKTTELKVHHRFQRNTRNIMKIY